VDAFPEWLQKIAIIIQDFPITTPVFLEKNYELLIDNNEVKSFANIDF